MPAVRPIMLAIVWMATTIPLAARPPADDLARVLAGWEQRRQAVTTARYSLVTTSGPSDPQPDRPPLNRSATGTDLFLLDFGFDRLRADWDITSTEPANHRRPSRRGGTIRYDGREQFSAWWSTPDAATAPPDLSRTKIVISSWGEVVRLPGEVRPLFWAHGRPGSARPGGNKEPLGSPPERGQFAAAGREVVGGRSCVVLRDATAPPGQSRTLWADPDRTGAVVQARLVSGNGAAVEHTIAYRETPHGWLPAGWTEARTSAPGRTPDSTGRVRIESAAYNVRFDPAEFQIALKPGMAVEKDGDEYRVGAGGTLEKVDLRPESAPPRSAFGRVARAVAGAGWWVGGGFILVAGLVVILIRLRRRRQTAVTA